MQLKKFQKGLILVCNGLVQSFSHYGTHTTTGTPTTVYWYAALIQKIKIYI